MSHSDENEPTYTVGYKKPPVETRFKKGHAGRPRGKAVARKDFLEEVLEQLDEMVPVTKNGKRGKMPGRTVSAKNFAQDVMKGDAKARAQFIQLIKQHRGSSPDGAPTTPSAGDLIKPPSKENLKFIFQRIRGLVEEEEE